MPPHSLAAVTVPVYVLNPMLRDSSPRSLTDYLAGELPSAHLGQRVRHPWELAEPTPLFAPAASNCRSMRQQLPGMRHVLVAQVPRGNASTEHGPVSTSVAHRLRHVFAGR